VAPADISATLDMGLSTTVPMSISNSGAATATFELQEQDRGFSLLLSPIGGRGQWLYRSDTGVPMRTNRDDSVLAYPSAYRWQPEGFPSALNILIYADDAYHTAPNTFLDQALQTLGLAYTAHYDGDWTGFENDLTSGGPWDLVLVGNDNWSPPSSVWTALDNYVMGGGKLVYQGWTVGRDPGNALWTTLGFTWVSNDTNPPDPVYWWEPRHPMFTNPASVPEFTSLTGDRYGIYGQHVEPLAGFEPLAGYTTPGPDPNQAAMILGNDGRTVFKGFLDGQNDSDLDADTVPDGVELWENIIYGLLHGFGGDVLWLSEDPITGTVSADGGLAPIDVTLDAAYVALPGEYYAVLNVNSDDPVDSRIPIPVTMTVNLPATYGKLEGTVYSLGYCDVNTTTLEGAEVLIEGHPLSLTTDVSGTYLIWLDQGTYTVTASYAEHLTAAMAVTVTAQTTTTQDFALRWLRPCLSVDPDSLTVTLGMGMITTLPLTLTDNGAAALEFEIGDRESGFSPLGVNWEVPEEAGSYITTLSPTDIEGVNILYDDAHGGSPTYYDDLMADLVAAGATVDIVSVGPIDAALLANYQVYWVPDATSVAWTAGELTAIENWVKGGGGMFVNYDCCDSATVPVLTALFDINYTGTGGTGGVTSDIAAHETTEGVSNLNLPSPYQSLSVSGSAEVIVNDVGGDPQVAVNEVDGGRVLVVADDAFNDGIYDDNDNALFADNIFNWLAIGADAPWLFEDPITGTVSAYSAVPVTVTFDAAQVAQPGIYQASLQVSSDDPYTPTISVPVTMTVQPSPNVGKLRGAVTSLGHCDVDPAPLEDAEVFIEGSTGMTWTLTTDISGTYQRWLDEAHSPLTVTVTHPDHETDMASGVMVTGQMTTTQDFALRWLQPCISVDPDSLAVTVGMDMSTTLPLTLTNSGAAAATFRLREQDRGFITLTQPSLASPPHTGGQAHIVNEDKDKKEAIPDVIRDTLPLPLASGGPDPFGYIYRDSNEADGPTYEWIEIAPPAGGSGTEITGLTGVDDGYFWPLSLPFTFDFYGTDYVELAVASNGTLYFEDDYLGYVNTPIPGTNGYGVNTFIAHFWDDLVVDPGAVYYLAQGEMFIVEYYQVRGYGASGAHGTWQVILFENGSILFQYQDVTIGPSFRDYGGSATVGIQGDVTTGLQYSYNTAALADTLAICFAYPGNAPDCSDGDAPWLSVDPIIGTVSADSTSLVSVTLDASVPEVVGPGEYHATLHVWSTDPINAHISVPVTMTVSSNTPPSLTGLPDKVFTETTGLPGIINLWDYASDAESSPDELIYTIDNTPPTGAGVTLSSNRYVIVDPSTSWCGGTDVRIRATDPGGLWDEDAFRVAVSWSCPGPVEMPGAPVLIVPVDGRTAHSDAPTFAWHEVGAAEAYQIQVDDDADFLAPEVDETTTGTEYTLASGLSDGMYTWRVRASNAAGVGDWSPALEFTVSGPPASGFEIFLPMVVRDHP
jgi:hypothetical protein